MVRLVFSSLIQNKKIKIKIGNTLYTREKKDKEVKGDPDVNPYCCRKNPYIWIVIVKGVVDVYRIVVISSDARRENPSGPVSPRIPG
jgi:hypothetical protein